jgi:hypothetical protein
MLFVLMLAGKREHKNSRNLCRDGRSQDASGYTLTSGQQIAKQNNMGDFLTSAVALLADLNYMPRHSTLVKGSLISRIQKRNISVSWLSYEPTSVTIFVRCLGTRERMVRDSGSGPAQNTLVEIRVMGGMTQRPSLPAGYHISGEDTNSIYCPRDGGCMFLPDTPTLPQDEVDQNVNI